MIFARGGMPAWPRRSSSAIESRSICSRSSSRAAAWLVAEEDALGDRQVVDEVELLVDRRDAASERAGRVTVGERLAVEEDLAGGRLDDARDALDQRRLARAVGPEQAVDFAGRDVEVNALQAP